jgi:hypothetical protein
MEESAALPEMHVEKVLVPLYLAAAAGAVAQQDVLYSPG